MSHHTLRLVVVLPMHLVHELDHQATAAHLNLEDYLSESIYRLATHPPLPTAIRFTETTMAPTEAGQTQVFTGTLSPAGATMPADATFTVTSNDTAVSPSVDSTGLIVSVTYPEGWVESTTTPLAFSYTASSASTGMSLTATITPSAPAVVPTGITFAQTT
jgi:hypothetical protein